MQIGLYESAASLQAMNKSLDTIASNLAHIGTPAYKGRISVIGSFSQQLQIAGSQIPIPAAREFIDFKQGPLIPTGNSYDLAINGRGFFRVETPNGPRYTRGGSFFPNPDGTIMNQGGDRLMLNGGALNANEPIKVDDSGNISQNGKSTGARLQVYDFDDYGPLVPENGGNYRIDPSQAKPSTAQVQAGYLEQSNLSAVDALVGLVSVNRSFESATRAMHTLDETMQRVTTAL
ncbi:MAG: flagellar hook basal-body protein [Planctomycetes bacterium]|nr:flagellar hook basal-body protein [Planctomycetota bacterium]